jgi:hypothetical protein
VVAVRLWPVSLLVMVTVTFGMATPDGSVMVPLRPDVPADCAINEGRQTANNRVKIATNASCEQSSVLDLMVPLSLYVLYGENTHCPVRLQAPVEIFWWAGGTVLNANLHATR